MSAAGPALDDDDARRRMDEAAAEAKRLQAEGRGWEAFDAWDRYQLIQRARAAQERSRRAAARRALLER